VAAWAVAVKRGQCGQRGHNGHANGFASIRSTASTKSTPPADFPEIAANGALALIAVATALLDRQMQAQAKTFEQEGGFTERLYRTRTQTRGQYRKS
jgi:four helix bundle suffix protein